MRYVFNSAIITTPGIYTYRLITIEEAKQWLISAPFKATIGYQETAKALSFLTGITFNVNRKMTNMNEGDEALISNR